MSRSEHSPNADVPSGQRSDVDVGQSMFSTHVLPAKRRPPVVAPIPLASVSSVLAPNATALLVFDANGGKALQAKALQRSLASLLSAYPQLCGRLRMAHPNDPGPAYTKRYLRTWIEHGNDDDPGFLFEVDRRPDSISTIFPAETGYEGVLDLEKTADMTLAPSLVGNVATNRASSRDQSNAGVKLTQFSDGATLCLSASHMLFDAGALGQFLVDWVKIHRALQAGEHETLVPQRDYDWSSLDGSASGDLNADEEDPYLTKLESRLDVLRYDSWARNAPGGPQPPPAMDMRPHSSIDAIDAARGRPRGVVPPWETLSSTPLLKYAILFKATDVRHIYENTLGFMKRAGQNNRACNGGTISAQDVFVGHLWRSIARARSQERNNDLLEFAMACDCRRRFRIPSPLEQPGCFNVCLGFNATASDVLRDDEGLWVAKRIRKAVDTLGPEVLGAWLHRRAHDLDPTREMIVFPGNRSVCTTNWARSDLFDVDFGTGRPLFVHNLVNAFGGYATIMRQCGGTLDRTGATWYDPGVWVNLWLEVDAMRSLLNDPHLRG